METSCGVLDETALCHPATMAECQRAALVAGERSAAHRLLFAVLPNAEVLGGEVAESADLAFGRTARRAVDRQDRLRLPGWRPTREGPNICKSLKLLSLDPLKTSCFAGISFAKKPPIPADSSGQVLPSFVGAG